MKPTRIVYVAVLLVSISLAWVFYYRYQMKDNELIEYRRLSRYSNEAFRRLSAKLSQNKKELEQSLKKIDALNKNIAILEKDNLAFKDGLRLLIDEREKLQAKIARLIQAKTALEAQFLSVEELKIALKRAKSKKRQEDRLAKIAMLEKLDEIALRLGNRGYMIKEGQTTFKSPRIRVQLEPIDKLD